MRITRTLLAVAVACAAPLRAPADGTPTFDWSRWRELPVQNGGRHKPLDTLGWETLRLLGNRSTLIDPETGQKLDGTALYLSMLFDWQGWTHEGRGQLLLVNDWRPYYFHLHKPDKWDQAPLLRVDYLELRAKLGLDSDQAYISPAALAKAAVEEPRTARRLPFTAWGDELLRRQRGGESLTKLEKKALELADRLWAYQDLRMGRGLEVLPTGDGQTRDWLPVAHFLLTDFNDDHPTAGSGDPRRALADPRRAHVRALLRQAWSAYHRGDAATFDRTADELKAELRGLGEQGGDYPSTFSMKLETAYNHWVPARLAWMFLLVAFVGMLVHLATGWVWAYRAALAAYVPGLVLIAVSAAMRVAIAGRPPVTNMYESVVYVGFGVALLGLVFELIHRARFTLAAAAAVSVVALVLADNSPVILDPSVRPLEPVLRSNFWLVTHVMTITLSYAAFALALGIANITLGYLLLRPARSTTIGALSRLTYRAIQVGVLLLAAGTILGGVWADYSWGRFWGWDPKEVWALVALLGYLAVLHARFIGWVGHRGLAAMSVVCFSLVVMAWYGVNFVLGAGLHSYGFGGGGQGWVYSAVALELFFTGLALLRSRALGTATSGSAFAPSADQANPAAAVLQWKVSAEDDASVGRLANVLPTRLEQERA
jgi:cytochrome c-type biogenesis protein CcsB